MPLFSNERQQAGVGVMSVYKGKVQLGAQVLCRAAVSHFFEACRCSTFLENPGFAQPPWSWQLQLFTLALECLGTELFGGRAARLLWGLPAVEIPAFSTAPVLCSQQRFQLQCFFLPRKQIPCFSAIFSFKAA